MQMKQVFVFCILMISVSTHANDTHVPNDKKKIEQTDNDWMQEFHEKISNSVYQSAQWFDSFFITNDDEQQSPKTTARIRLAWLSKSRDLIEFKPRFRLRVKLPHFKNKLSLVLSDEDDELNNLPLESSNINANSNNEKFSLALNYTKQKDKKRLMDFRAGFSSGDIFVRARHKSKFIINKKHKFLIEPSLSYYLGDGLGARLLLEYDYQLRPNSLFRMSSSIRKSEAFNDNRWEHGFYKLDQIDENTATIWSLQVEGKSGDEQGGTVDNYRVGYRYRFNALTDWLYFEIEPFLEFPEQENYKKTPGIALRVEGFFTKVD